MSQAAYALAKREMIRFFRQPHRVAGSLAQPLLIWGFLGAGFSPSFHAPGLVGVSYSEYFYPGVLLMLMLFSGIFSTITVIEDRNQGLLQGVLTSPASRGSIVMGKVLGGMGVALIQTIPLLLAAPLMGLHPSIGSILLIVLGFVIACMGFTTLGLIIAWNMESTAGFHAIMSVFLMPLWMLSGALFPLDEAPLWLWGIMTANPVTYTLELIRQPLYQTPADLMVNSSYLIALGVAVGWAVFCLSVAFWRVNQVEKGVSL